MGTVESEGGGSPFLEGLIADAAAGDREAQDGLLREFWPLIRAAVRGRKNRMGKALGLRELTEDLEQQAAMRVLQELGKHRWQGRSAFVAWVKKLSSFEVVDAHRHHAAEMRHPGRETGEDKGHLPSQHTSPESRFEGRQRISEIMARVGELKPEYGAALLMHHLGYTHAEIGEALHCTPEAARKLVSRARARLIKSG